MTARKLKTVEPIDPQREEIERFDTWCVQNGYRYSNGQEFFALFDFWKLLMEVPNE